MPCVSETATEFVLKQTIEDYTKIHVYVADGVCEPQNLKQLVRAIKDAEDQSKKIKAQGSCYSLSTAQVTDDYLILTGALNRHLSQPYPPVADSKRLKPVARFRSSKHDSNWLERIAKPKAQNLIEANKNLKRDKKFLVHVEAGIKIKQLLADLESMGLALPTMGAGGGQSLAGALSTGTHGSDRELAPLTDFVRAIHLVGPGGQEWWIEPSDGLVGGHNLTELPGWCPDTYIVRDDEWFNAALVTAGRFGVIYSYVLEVREAFWLHETSQSWLDWTDIRAKLKAKTAWASDRFFSVTIDTARGVKCWTQRRHETTDHTEEGLEPSSVDAILCQDPVPIVNIIVAMKPLFVALQGQVVAVPVIGAAWAVRIEGLWMELMHMANTSLTMGEFLPRAVSEVFSLGEAEVGFAAPELKAIMMDVCEHAINAVHPKKRRGISRRIVDGEPDKRRGCISANSAEFFFDANKSEYLDFVDEVLKAARDVGPVPGYVSLRFTQKSKALLAEQRFDNSVAIEVAVPRRPISAGELYPEFVKRLHKLAKKYEAIPHWGQVHSLTPKELEERYGSNVEPWRWALSELEQGPRSWNGEPKKTFKSAFSSERGLEVEDGKTAVHHRDSRSSGILVSSLISLANPAF